MKHSLICVASLLLFGCPGSSEPLIDVGMGDVGAGDCCEADSPTPDNDTGPEQDGQPQGDGLTIDGPDTDGLIDPDGPTIDGPVNDAPVDDSSIIPDALPDDQTPTGDTFVDTGPFLLEICDGEDNNQNGDVDEGTYVPKNWDAATWMPAGFFNLVEPHLLVIKKKRIYGVLMPSAVMNWTTTFDEINTNNPNMGVTLPSKDYTAALTLPTGFMGMVTDHLEFIHGSEIYSLHAEAAQLVGVQNTIHDVIVNFPVSTDVDAATVVSDAFFPVDAILFFAGDTMWTLFEDATVVETPLEETLYPPNSTGAYPHGLPLETAFTVPTQYGFATTANQNIYVIVAKNANDAFTWFDTPISTDDLFPCFQ